MGSHRHFHDEEWSAPIRFYCYRSWLITWGTETLNLVLLNNTKSSKTYEDAFFAQFLLNNFTNYNQVVLIKVLYYCASSFFSPGIEVRIAYNCIRIPFRPRTQLIVLGRGRTSSSETSPDVIGVAKACAEFSDDDARDDDETRVFADREWLLPQWQWNLLKWAVVSFKTHRDQLAKS